MSLNTVGNDCNNLFYIQHSISLMLQETQNKILSMVISKIMQFPTTNIFLMFNLGMSLFTQSS